MATKPIKFLELQYTMTQFLIMPGICFFFIEIFTILHYTNEKSDDVIGGSTKTVQHSISNVSRIIKAVFFKLGTLYITKERK